MIGEDFKRARNVVVAAYLGWTLDAFDFFILIFTLDNVAKEFGVSITSVAFSITVTLATRAIGALIFGRLADHYGRKPVLMLVILLYSFFEAATGFAWSFTSFLVIRTLFGIAMGGEWGVGSSLAMETIPERWRGWVSGLLQAGYPSGYFLATLLFGFGLTVLGWRGMFFVGALPAILIFFINANVQESPAFVKLHEGPRVSVWTVLRKNAGLAVYAVIRGTFPGFVYQLGNFVASFNAPLQAEIATNHGGDYGFALMVVAATVAVVLIVLMIFGPERKNISMASSTPA